VSNLGDDDIGVLRITASKESHYKNQGLAVYAYFFEGNSQRA
jgi:hypothetical protein